MINMIFLVKQFTTPITFTLLLFILQFYIRPGAFAGRDPLSRSSHMRLQTSLRSKLFPFIGGTSSNFIMFLNIFRMSYAVKATPLTFFFRVFYKIFSIALLLFLRICSISRAIIFTIMLHISSSVLPPIFPIYLWRDCIAPSFLGKFISFTFLNKMSRSILTTCRTTARFAFRRQTQSMFVEIFQCGWKPLMTFGTTFFRYRLVDHLKNPLLALNLWCGMAIGLAVRRVHEAHLSHNIIIS